MHESFVSVLLSPINLLFLINAFFLIFLSSFIWKIFCNLNYTQSLFNAPNPENNQALTLKIAFFSPLVLIAFIAEYHWSLLQHVNFFPLVSSSFVKFNLLGLIISLIILIIIKNHDKKPEAKTAEQSLFIIAYFIVLYLFYLIILMATVIVRMNAFSDGFTHNYPEAILYVLYGLFLLHLILVFFAVSMKNLNRVLLLLAYTGILALAYSIR